MRALLSKLLCCFLLTSGVWAEQFFPFTDSDLSKLLEQEGGGLIYLWSPGMPLSEKGLREARKVCEKMDVSFVALSDPFAFQFTNSLESDRLFGKGLILRPMASRKLEELGVMDHFPAMIFFRDGKILRPIVHGYEFPEEVKNHVQQFLSVQPQ